MSSVAEIVSKRIGNSLTNVQTWGGILYNVKSYGAVGDGVTDDTVAIQAAINAALAAGNGVVAFPSADYRITSGFVIDISMVTIQGRGSRLICDSIPTGEPALTVYSSVSTELNKFTKNVTHAIENISIYRTSYLAGSIGLQYGSATYTSNNDFKIKGFGVWNFDTNLKFIDNSWRAYFDECSFVSDSTSNTNQILFDNPTNSGEAMNFTHCIFLGNATPSLLNGGYWHFEACSFLHSTITTGGSGVAILSGCNIESLDHANYRMINHLSDPFFVKLDGCTIIVNSGGLAADAWTESPIRNTSVESGMHLESCFIQQGSVFAFYTEAGNNVNQLITGAGRVTVGHMGTFDDLVNNRNVLISKSLNPLYNGDAETGNTDGWTFAAYGTAGTTMTATAGSAKNGSYGFDFQAVDAGGGNALQYFRVEPGRLVLLQCWGQKKITASSAGFIQLEFYEETKTNKIGSTLSQEIGFGGQDVWTYQYTSGVVPVGAAWAKVILNVQALTPASQVYFDDVTLNFI